MTWSSGAFESGMRLEIEVEVVRIADRWVVDHEARTEVGVGVDGLDNC